METVTGHRMSLASTHYIRVHHFGYLTAAELALNHSLYVVNVGPVRIRSIKREMP